LIFFPIYLFSLYMLPVTWFILRAHGVISILNSLGIKKIQGVPLATKPGISLIILPLMRILQRNLKRTYLIV